MEPVFGPEVSLTLARLARHLAEAASTRPVVVDTTDPAMRHYLHRLGFAGTAGHVLEAGPDAATPVPPVTSTEQLAAPSTISWAPSRSDPSRWVGSDG